MRKNPTAPVVITDTNGKVTTVHRRVAEAPSTRTSIPAVSMTKSTDPTDDKLESMCAELLKRAEDVDDKRLAYRAKAAYYNRDDETLAILHRYTAGENANGADYTVQAINLLNEYGEDPEEVLTPELISSICRMREALMRWENKYDNYKGGDIEHGMENRDALTLFLIEKPGREKLMIRAMENGIGDATQMMHLDEGIPMSLLDGAL